MADVTIVDNVGLALLAELAGGADVAHTLGLLDLLEVIVCDNLGLNEVLLEVGVDGAGGLRGGPAAGNGPAADLLIAGGEEVDEVKRLEALSDDAGDHASGGALLGSDAGLLVGEELLLVLDGEGDHRAAAVLVDPLHNLGEELVALADEVLLGEVNEIDLRLGGDEAGELLLDELDLSGGPVAVLDGEVLAEHVLELVHRGGEGEGQLELRVALQLLLLILDGLVDEDEILLAELEGDRLEVTNRINRLLNVLNIGVLEGADHVEDTVDGANVGEELVAEASALRGAADEAGDIPDLQVGGVLGGRVPHVAEVVVALVGDGAAGLVGVNGAEGEVLRLSEGGLREEVEERGLANVGKANDTHLEGVLDATEADAAVDNGRGISLLGGHGCSLKYYFNNKKNCVF